MATAHTDLQFGGLIKCLIDKDILTEADATKHNEDAKKNKTPIISYLVSNKLVDGNTIASVAYTDRSIIYKTN